MPRYVVVIADNRVRDVTPLADEDEEYLGIEWALSEIKDSHRHAGTVTGSFSLADEAELQEFLDFLKRLLGPGAVPADVIEGVRRDPAP